MTWNPHVTVAAIIERAGKFLIVEELSQGQTVFNQPAGHWDEGETLLEAVVRETLEEAAYQFIPEAITGIYHWIQASTNITYLRLCFSGQCGEQISDISLDTGIQHTLWLSRDELAANQEKLRSPMVLRSIDDYLVGTRYGLDLLTNMA